MGLDPFITQMEATIREFSLLETHDRILIGVSGGPDSMALLDGLHRLSTAYEWQLTVAHVHHGLRGKEADEDALFVERFCQEHNIAYELCRRDVRAHLIQHGGNLQEVARNLRYEAFQAVARQIGAQKLALGHHADDRAETVLMRFLRGTGASGLAGIPVKQKWDEVEVVRPLWRMWRQDIEAYCEKRKLMPRVDSSNSSLDYMRNRIRLKLIPELQRYNPQVKKGMLQLSEQLAAEEEVWENWTKDALKRVLVKRDEMEWQLSVPALRNLSVALQRRVIQLILNYLTIRSWKHIEKIRRLIDHVSSSTECSLPGNWKAVRDYDLIRLYIPQETVKQEGFHIRLHIPGMTKLPMPYKGMFEAIVTREKIETDKWEVPWAVFDAAELAGALYIRTRKRGDRIHIKGMKGRKKVKDLFIDEKIPRRERERWPCVADEKDILWIPGLRRSAKALVNETTDQRLYLLYHT